MTFSTTLQYIFLQVRIYILQGVVSEGSFEQYVILGAHGFNAKSVSPAYIAHFLAQDFSHILDVFLVGVLLFTPHSRSILCTTKI